MQNIHSLLHLGNLSKFSLLSVCHQLTHLKRFILIILSCALCFSNANAQVPIGRSNSVTLFDHYNPAVIEFADGHCSNQSQANIFLKNSSLLYKSGINDMEAKMVNIKSVVIDRRRFINVKNQLAEVIDTCGGDMLLKIVLIDMEAFQKECLNNSNITNIEIGESLGVTRLDADPSVLKYPLCATYYYMLDSKIVRCHERDVQRAIGKARQRDYKVCVARQFDWSKERDLSELLKVLNKK